jgi:hypothetical protein
MCGVFNCNKKKYTLLLGMVALCTKKQTSSLAGPMLRVDCTIFSPLAWPPLPPFPPFHMGTLTTIDDINMPESSSLGHKDKVKNRVRLVRES